MNNACDAVEGVENPAITIELTHFFADADYLKAHPYVNSGAFACISISDNGCGIDEQILQHIYEPFFTTKAVGRGTGLGLSMAYGAIKSHGGHIEVSAAAAGQGTQFKVYLPLLAEIAAPVAAESGDEIISGRGETILLVDDNKFVLETGKALLEELNYKVMTAADGQQAIDMYRELKHEIDLLVLDVVMPVIGGVEALRVIRQEAPQVKAIFCTGYDKLNVGFSAEGVNRETVLSKPFGINKLSQIVRRTLG